MSIQKRVRKTYQKVYVVRYGFWDHLYNFKNVKNTHGACNFTLLKAALLTGVFHVFYIIQMAQNDATHLMFSVIQKMHE